MDAIEIGRRLKTAREARGLSQAELGAIIGVGQARVADYEAGRTLPSLPRFFALVDGGALEPDTLFSSIKTQSGKKSR